MNRLALLRLRGRRISNSISITSASTVTATFAFRPLGPRCIRMCGGGLLLLRLRYLRAVWERMLHAVAFAAFVQEIVVLGAYITKLSRTSGRIETIACP